MVALAGTRCGSTGRCPEETSASPLRCKWRELLGEASPGGSHDAKRTTGERRPDRGLQDN